MEIQSLFHLSQCWFSSKLCQRSVSIFCLVNINILMLNFPHFLYTVQRVQTDCVFEEKSMHGNQNYQVAPCNQVADIESLAPFVLWVWALLGLHVRQAKFSTCGMAVRWAYPDHLTDWLTLKMSEIILEGCVLWS